MPVCRSCGATYAEGERVCSACGESVAPGQPTASFEPIEEPTPSAHPAEEPPSDSPVLVVRKGPQPGERFYLEKPALSIGRDPDSDIFLNDVTVSRVHASLTVSGGVVTVTDSASLNGTYVNDVCVDAAVLRDGDLVQVGTFQMVFFSGGESRR